MPAGWSTAGSSLRALRFGLLDAPLDVADRVEVLGQLRRDRAAPSPRCSRPTSIGHRVEDAAVLLRCAPRRDRRVGGAAVAEQPLEHRARVVLHRQRRRRAAPGDRVGVGAAVAGVARRRRTRVDSMRQLERGELRVAGRVALASDLIHRHAGQEVATSVVNFGGTPVRNRVAARAWSPEPARLQRRRTAVQAADDDAAGRGTARAASGSA